MTNITQREIWKTLREAAQAAHEKGHVEEAERLFKRALDWAKRGDQLHYASCLTDLAEMYADEGRFSDACTVYQQALEIYRKNLGPNDDSVGAALRILAQLARKNGCIDEAKEYELLSAQILRAH